MEKKILFVKFLVPRIRKKNHMFSMRKNKIDKKEKRDLPLALMHKLELDKAPTENYKS